MKKSDLVSIIIPCYNQAQYLEEAVQSAIDQTYPDMEIIIVNDGSPDNTQEVAEELQKKYSEKIKIISQKNSGVSEARNNGIRNASGNYIIALDADDKLHKTMVEKSIKTLKQYDADIVYGGYQGFGISDRVNMWTPFEQTYPLYAMPCAQLALTKKKVWKVTGGYNTNMKEGYEDWEYWVNAYKHNMKFVHIPEKLYFYRIKEESRDTNAVKKDTYLRSKIVMNHSELYTTHQVENSIETIKETEDLAELYFYTPKNASMTDKKVIQAISRYLSTNSISGEDHLTMDDKNIKLYALDNLKNAKEIKKIIKQSDTKNLFFYAPMRYQVAELKHCDFAWKNKSMIEAEGTFFSYVFNEVQKNTKLQLIAHKRLEKYHEYIQDKLNNLQKKYDNDMNNANRKFTEMQKKYDNDMNNTNRKFTEMQKKYDNDMNNANRKFTEMQKKYDNDMNNANNKFTESQRQLHLVYASASYRLGRTLLHEKKALFNPKKLLGKIKIVKKLGNKNIQIQTAANNSKMKQKKENNQVETPKVIDKKHISNPETNIETPILSTPKGTTIEQNSVNINNCITEILLNNSSEIELSEAKRKECLNYYKILSSKKSEFVIIKDVNPIPKDWPKDLVLVSLPENTNDFKWNLAHKQKKDFPAHHKSLGLSIIIPTFNRSKLLGVTLACLVNQRSDYKFEVIVADDGSKEDLSLVTREFEDKLDIKLVRQRDYGYQLCAVRNLGLRTAKYDYVSILDCDMAPDISWVQSYMELLIEDDDVALIGPRKYVDTHDIDPKVILNKPELISSLPEVVTNNNVAGKTDGEISVDWRLKHFKESDNLRLCDTPFRYFSGGNVAFSKKWLDIAGYFDEEFTHWGGEDVEFGYRLYRAGCYFRAVDGGLAYHQEPPGKENETDRAAGKEITIKIVEQKVPYFYRKLQNIESAVVKKVPMVSIYIPAYNCEDSIVKCIESALNQTVTDLEVCVCDDGSTDGTLEVLKSRYSNNPRVKYITQKNGGIGKASNSAVKMTKGFYIGQLDSDDYLEPDAIELCLKEFMNDRQLACVYTTNRNVKPDGSLISNGYNWPTYSREKLATAMICHHFRMFTARAWNLTSGFNEEITNAIDYDMYLKLSNVGPFKHINKICYNRVLHGNNTSITKIGLQTKNHFLVVNMHLQRNYIYHIKYMPLNDKDSCRKYIFTDMKNEN